MYEIGPVQGVDTLKQPVLMTKDGYAQPRLNSFEHEYSIVVRSLRGRDVSQAANEILSLAKSGRLSEYQENGARHYNDGFHPEVSTAEELDPLGSAIRALLGHLDMIAYFKPIFEQIKNAQAHHDTLSLSLIANTVDPYDNSWASHENNLSLRRLHENSYKAAFTAHNVSRIVWSGAGHVKRSHNQQGYIHVLSEKADQFFSRFNKETKMYRPIVNARDEPLGDKERYRRIHGITGETVFSTHVNALRLFSDSILLRACELGVDFTDLEPINPITAMRTISNDPTLQARVPVRDGRYLTGVELQLELATRALTAIRYHNYLTPAESEWGDKWIQLLEDLASDPMSCLRRLNWLIKTQFIEKAVRAKQPNEEAYQVAIRSSVDFHTLLPGEGAGMQLVRKGFLEDSPSAEILKNGLDLPPTRAMLRGTGIAALNAKGVSFTGTWDVFTIGHRSPRPSLPMKDYLQTTSGIIDRLIAEYIPSKTASPK